MKIKKALLFVPPALTFQNNLDINPVPPLGLAYIGAVLEKMGLEVKIYDCLIEGWDNRREVKPGIVQIGVTPDEIRRQIVEFNPDIVGVNNLFSRQRKNAHSIYALAKEVNPNIITVAGGAHPTVMSDLVLQDKNVDFVVLGEGEVTVRNLVEHLEGKRSLDDVDGIAFRKNGEIKIAPKKTFIENLDEIPFPAWNLLNFTKYFGLKLSHGKRRHKAFAPIITSRGCPAGCSFCTAHHVWGRGYRCRSAENVIDEMRQLKNNYGIKELLCEDDNTT
ncbi:MAG TPA: B12-binding domain-containing radical SAM protein [Candidatus Omnitrophica bacterium]|nr:B12-binding domain-containing radical SAM protein [Candidatus Omnitrophota bacterium]